MPQHKEAVWHFFTTQVVPVIHRYQLMNDWGQEGGSEGEGTMTAEMFEEHLLKAVAYEPPCVVNVLFQIQCQPVYHQCVNLIPEGVELPEASEFFCCPGPTAGKPP